MLYDEFLRPPAPAETDVVGEWSPIWIELQLDELLEENLSPGMLPQLRYFLAHLKDINQPHEAKENKKNSSTWTTVDGIELDPKNLEEREQYYTCRNRYVFSTQELIFGLLYTDCPFQVRPDFMGEMDVERSFGNYINLIRHIDWTVQKS